MIESMYNVGQTLKNKNMTHIEIYKVVDKYFEKADKFAYQDNQTMKEYDQRFCEFIKKKEPRLANDSRNFYLIYNKYCPQ